MLILRTRISLANHLFLNVGADQLDVKRVKCPIAPRLKANLRKILELHTLFNPQTET